MPAARERQTNRNVVPLPNSLSAEIVPPWASTNWSHEPQPEPDAAAVVLRRPSARSDRTTAIDPRHGSRGRDRALRSATIPCAARTTRRESAFRGLLYRVRQQVTRRSVRSASDPTRRTRRRRIRAQSRALRSPALLSIPSMTLWIVLPRSTASRMQRQASGADSRHVDEAVHQARQPSSPACRFCRAARFSAGFTGASASRLRDRCDVCSAERRQRVRSSCDAIDKKSSRTRTAASAFCRAASHSAIEPLVLGDQRLEAGDAHALQLGRARGLRCSSRRACCASSKNAR